MASAKADVIAVACPLAQPNLSPYPEIGSLQLATCASRAGYEVDHLDLHQGFVRWICDDGRDDVVRVLTTLVAEWQNSGAIPSVDVDAYAEALQLLRCIVPVLDEYRASTPVSVRHANDFQLLARLAKASTALASWRSTRFPKDSRSIVAAFTRSSPLKSFLEDSAESVLRQDPGTIALTLMDGDQWTGAIWFAMALRQCGFRGTIVVGGGAVTALDDRMPRLNHLRRYVDFACTGDGEDALLSLLRQERPPENLFRFGKQLTPPRPVVRWRGATDPNFSFYENIDQLWCAEGRGYRGIPFALPVVLSRGCTWGECAYCSHPYGRDPARSEPLMRAVSYLEQLRAGLGCNAFELLDSDVPCGRLRKLCNALTASTNGTKLSLQTRAGDDFTPDFCKDIGRVVASIRFGMETASDRILSLVDKGVSRADITSTVHNLLEFAPDTEICLNLMFGFPSERFEEAEETLQFVHGLKQLSPDRIHTSFNAVAIRRKSPFYATPERFGIRIAREDDLELSPTWNAPLWVPDLMAHQLHPARLRETRKPTSATYQLVRRPILEPFSISELIAVSADIERAAYGIAVTELVPFSEAIAKVTKTRPSVKKRPTWTLYGRPGHYIEVDNPDDVIWSRLAAGCTPKQLSRATGTSLGVARETIMDLVDSDVVRAS